jgi:hypothetical protein
MFADKAIQLARGGADVTLNTLTSSPKVSSYALRTHTGSDLEAVTGTETAYNREVFRRRHLLKTGEKVYDEDTGEWTGEYLKTDPNQGVLFSASETVSYTPNDRSDETAEDVYMNMVSAKRAAEKGGNVVDPMKAMDLVEGAMQKGRGAEGALTNTVRTPDHPPHALLTKPEALHMINNHATRRAAEHFGVTSLVRGEAVFERPTAGTGIQPVVWTQARRDVGEDSDFKASSTAHMKALDVQGKQKRSDDAEIKSRQGTIEGSYHKESPELFVPKATKAGKLRLKIDKRKTLRPMTGDPK